MRVVSTTRKYLTLIGLCLFILGFSNVKITDIETAIIEKDFQKAEEMALELINSQPAEGLSDELWYYLGISQLGLQQYPQARESFQRLLTEETERNVFDKASLGVIDSYILSGDFQAALGQVEQLLEERKDSQQLSLIYLKAARINLKMTNWKTARDYLQKIRKEFPQSLEAHLAQQLLEEKQHFAVQVGSFLDKNLAIKLVNEFKVKGEYAYIIETLDQDKRKFYRVRVGRFSRLDEAQELKQKLSMQGYPTQIYP